MGHILMRRVPLLGIDEAGQLAVFLRLMIVLLLASVAVGLLDQYWS
jgi:hypothetical protein